MTPGAQKTILYAALFAALTAAGALIRIPLPPVPFTLQTVFVFLAAGLFGVRIGVLSQVLYITLGLIGLPVFSGGGGIGYVMQPQFGYLLGMPLAALVIGALSQHTDGLSKRPFIAITVLIYLAGTLIIYTTGIAYLAYYTGVLIDADIDLPVLIWSGSIIFLPTDLIKIAAASWLTYKIKSSQVLAQTGDF